VPDEDDFCPNTFPGEDVDFDGCSCEDLGDCDCFEDNDLDDVADCDDFCLDTPFGADVDADGCACFEVDDDDDGIDNCDDLCPNSSSDATVDVDGCTVVIVEPGPVIACGNFSALMMGLTFTGLFLMRFSGHRDW
jgi:OOP family OmpA-OmpF porin